MKITIEKLKMETRDREFDFYYFPKEKLKGGNAIKLSIYYDKGGMNYWQGQTEPRAYWFSWKPVSKGEHTESMSAFSGVKVMLEEVARFNRKRLDFWIEKAQELTDKYIKDIKNKVIKQ